MRCRNETSSSGCGCRNETDQATRSCPIAIRHATARFAESLVPAAESRCNACPADRDPHARDDNNGPTIKKSYHRVAGDSGESHITFYPFLHFRRLGDSPRHTSHTHTHATSKMATTYVPLLTNHFGQFNQTKAADLYPNTDFDGLNVVEKLWGEFEVDTLFVESVC